ncbi:MAG: hypothetical protein D4S01_06230, partial [Dehalococcoidia bacterium]
ARPSMEAMGIDVVATAKKAGLRLNFGRDEARGWVGLILVDSPGGFNSKAETGKMHVT